MARRAAAWTTPDLMALWARSQAGEPTQALAAEWGVKPRNLTDAWNRLGLRTKARAGWDITDLMALWERRQAGELTKDLAAEWGAHNTSLTRSWNQLGLYPDANDHIPPDSYWLKLRRRVDAGEDVEVVAKRAGMSVGALKYHWRRIGLTPLGVRRKNPFPSMIRIWGMRREGLRWSEIVEILGWEKPMTTLRGAFHLWRKRARLPMVGPSDSVQRAATRKANLKGSKRTRTP